ncbi:MAG: M14 family metallopeptidase [Gemmatimonadaceae bacterium]|nr:M14 family metallopeptidase [Gemmatimonadaceae bacterium]
MPSSRPASVRRLTTVLVAVVTACAPSTTLRTAASPPRTQAERSGFTETSTHASVLAFLDALGTMGAPMHRGSIGTTTEGRDIPYVIASRPLYDTPEAARRSGRPIVYVQGNIHAGEVEGKEALQALLRDLLLDRRPNVLDSIVLIAVPIYNGDGNERFDHQAKNRGAQNGPEMVGQRPNARGLDLNRDYIKAEAPETRASLAMFNAWDPHLFVDLHTTNGSYHGYALTYAPSLHPAAELEGATFGAAWARDSLLPEVQRRVRARHNIATFAYGNFAQDEGASVPKGWLTYDHRPRFGTNYYALRGRVSVLSEAYSHDPFETRVRATYAFVRELLSLAAERGAALRGIAARSDAALRAWRAGGTRVPLRAEMTKTPWTGDVVYEVLERTTDTTRREPGVRAGMRRTGRFVTETMPIFDRFTPTIARPAPWGFAIPATDTAVIDLLARHGVEMHRLRSPWSGDAGPQYAIDSTVIAPRPFQGRREVRLVVRQVPRATSLAAGTIIVPVAQPLGVLAMVLLEPESDDGIVTWDVSGRATSDPAGLLMTRLARDPGAPMDRVSPRP